ncbi:hypothetical protein NE237_001821 [Protea cynaroides]|uniref:Uncharacterized protein n=1 Tax=Protea cynaroides TaxID=273540 RepID=A0A9Q0KU14_9MAGN|nr:hypothetical protein NE237_001821 [Protea cynaroides]
MLVLLLGSGEETRVGEGAGAEATIQLLKLRKISFSSGESLRIGGSYSGGLVHRIAQDLIKPSRVRDVLCIPHEEGRGIGDGGEEGLVGVTQRTLVVPNVCDFPVRTTLGDVTRSGFDTFTADIAGDVASAVVEAVNDIRTVADGGVVEIGSSVGGKRREKDVEVGLVGAVSCEKSCVGAIVVNEHRVGAAAETNQTREGNEEEKSCRSWDRVGTWFHRFYNSLP